MDFGHALIQQRHWYPKFVCYDSATDAIRRYVKMPGERLKITHHAKMEPAEDLNWALWIWKFLIDGLEGYEYGSKTI